MSDVEILKRIWNRSSQKIWPIRRGYGFSRGWDPEGGYCLELSCLQAVEREGTLWC